MKKFLLSAASLALLASSSLAYIRVDANGNAKSCVDLCRPKSCRVCIPTQAPTSSTPSEMPLTPAAPTQATPVVTVAPTEATPSVTTQPTEATPSVTVAPTEATPSATVAPTEATPSVTVAPTEATPSVTTSPTSTPFPTGICSSLYVPQFYQLIALNQLNSSDLQLDGRAMGSECILSSSSLGEGLVIEEADNDLVCWLEGNQPAILNTTTPLSIRAHPNVLFCNKSLSAQNSTLRGGHIAFRGNGATTSGINFSNDKCQTISNYSTIDFDLWTGFLQNMSVAYDQKATTGIATFTNDQLELNGTESFLEVFSIRIEDLLGIRSIKVNLNPTVSAVVINVLANVTRDTNSTTPELTPDFPPIANAGEVLGPVASKLLWNFRFLEAIRLRNISLWGTFLAPNMAVATEGNSEFNGNMWVSSVEGSLRGRVLEQPIFCWPTPVSEQLPNFEPIQPTTQPTQQQVRRAKFGKWFL